MSQTLVTKATLGRIPMYLEYLKTLDQAEYQYISATIIAKALGLGEVQVRKDLSSVSGEGKPKLGYVTLELIDKLEEFLGLSDHTEAVVIGAGKLGCALLGYGGFSKFGLEVVAGFDLDPEKVGPVPGGKPVLGLDELEGFCKSRNIRIGIITVPMSAAQDACDRLVASGIKAIWDFAPGSLNVPEDVILQQENLALSLAFLNEQLRVQE